MRLGLGRIKGVDAMFKRNREARQALYKQIRPAVANSRTAQKLIFDMGMQNDHGKRVTAQTASKEAMDLVYGVISSYVWPSPPELTYAGLRRTDARMATKELDHGVVTIAARVRTPMGVTLGIDVPVEIRNGQLLEPSIMFLSETPYVISQSSIDRIIRDNSSYGQLPTRKMYQGPHDNNEQMATAPMRVERRTPAMFSTRLASTGLREIIRSRGARGSLRLEQPESGPPSGKTARRLLRRP